VRKELLGEEFPGEREIRKAEIRDTPLVFSSPLFLMPSRRTGDGKKRGSGAIQARPEN